MKGRVYSGMQVWFNTQKKINIIYCINRLNMKNYYDLLIRHRKNFEKKFPCGSASKESARSVGNLGSIPGLGRSPGEGKGYPLQYSVLENSMDCIVHRVTKSQT